MTQRSLYAIGGGSCALYDDETGEIVGTASSPPCGQSGVVGGELVAEYVADGHLILQIGVDKFDLDDAETRAEVRGDGEMVTFRVTQGERQRHLRYEAWWSGWKADEPDLWYQYELLQLEDPLGWVIEVLKDRKARKDKKQHLLNLPFESKRTK